MKIDREALIAAGREGARDWQELARMVRTEWSREWADEVRKKVDGIADLLARNAAVANIQVARDAGNDAEVERLRKEIFSCTVRYMDAGIPAVAPAQLPDVTGPVGPVAPAGLPGAEAPVPGGGGMAAGPGPEAPKPARGGKGRVARPKPVKVDVEGLVPVAPGQVAGKVMSGLVLGLTGAQYHGRPVVAVKRQPGVFGTKAEGRAGVQLCTIRGGIVNQCDLKEPPTPYWAVLDFASGLGRPFTREEVLAGAVALLSEAGVKGADVKSAGIAWDVLKNHQHHPRKRDCGMGFIVDDCGGSGKARQMSVRPRDEAETQQYFEAQKARAVVSGRQKPAVATEAKPVVSVLEQPK